MVALVSNHVVEKESQNNHEPNHQSSPNNETIVEESQEKDLKRQPFHRWNQFTSHLKRPIGKVVTEAAVMSVRYPMTTIVVTILLSLSIVSIGIATNFAIENEGTILWTPNDCPTLAHRNWIESEESGYPQRSRDIQVLIHANGANLLDDAVDSMSKVFQVMDTIRQTPGYFELCALARNLVDNECPIESPSGFWKSHNSTLYQETIEGDRESANDEVIAILSSLQYANQEPVNRALIYGQPNPPLPDQLSFLLSASSASNDTNSTLQEEDIVLESLTAFLLNIALPPLLDEALPFELESSNRLFALEREWNKDPDNIVVLEQSNFRSFDDELLRAIQNDIPYMATAFLLMGFFCAFALSKRHAVESSSLLGAGAVATILLSIMTGYGLMFCIGVPFSSLTQVFPYVMVGIGLDDTFIITGAFSRTDPKEDMESRIRKAFSEVAVSISVSTLTTVVAFLLGSLSSLPGLRWFAWYAFPTVAIDFVYQVTFFVAILVMDDRRKKANRRDCCPCCIVKRSAEEGNKDGDDAGDVDDNMGNHEAEDHNDAASGPAIENSMDPTGGAERKKTFGTRFVDAYANILLSPLGKATVLVFFATLLAVGIWQASKQTQEFDWRELVPPDSFVRDFFAQLDIHMGQQANILFVSACYFRGIDVSVPENQEAMLTFIDDMVDIPYINSRPSNFWLEDFLEFQENVDEIRNLTFYDQLDVFLSVEPYSLIYKEDIIRDENKIVTASRTTVVFDGVDSYNNQAQIDALSQEQRVAAQQSVNVGKSPNDWQFFSYGDIYNAWELYATIVQEILLTVSLGLIAVFLIALIFLPHPFGALIVTPIVGAIYVELLGLLYLADIYVNSISAVGLTMSIGIVVDYNMHIILTYFEVQDASTRNERVRKVLHTMGKSIMLGGFSTFLGVLPLSLTSSTVFRTFFITFLGIVFFGAGHGLVFIPVLLSLIAPNRKPSTSLETTQERTIMGDLTTEEVIVGTTSVAPMLNSTMDAGPITSQGETKV